MGDKVKIFVYVDSDVWNKFRDYVFAKYGTLHTYLGDEISRAMEEYLKDSRSAHTHEFEHTNSKPNKRHIQLLRWLLEYYPFETLYSKLVDYVRNFGLDKRTIKKYVHEFLIEGGFVRAEKSVRGDVIMKVNAEVILRYLKDFLSPEEFERYRAIVQETKAAQVVEAREEKSNPVKEYIAERVEAGDSLDEIKSRLEHSGINISKRFVRRAIQKLMREKEGL